MLAYIEVDDFDYIYKMSTYINPCELRQKLTLFDFYKFSFFLTSFQLYRRVR